MKMLKRGLTACLLAISIAGCRQPPVGPIPAPDPLSDPDPAAVESVLFLVGDAGDATTERNPILTRLQDDIEWWATRLDSDSSVAVLVLGDIVYPEGLHPPGHPSRDSDTSVVMGQVRLVMGPESLRRGARMFFMAGNHDWGSRKDWEGYRRLRTLEEFFTEARARTGAAVELTPEAGAGGPRVVDMGDNLRLLLLDTAWWLLSGDDEQKAEVLRGIDEAFRTAGGREVMLAAHHPFRSVGPHGGFFPFWETAGVRYILARSGAILQDLTSVPYRGLENGLREIFLRHSPPLAFIGGHEHSLQVIESIQESDPRFTLVSGSASKLTGVGFEEGVRFASSVPGYMRVVTGKDGSVALYVEATPAEFLECGGTGAELAGCMAEGLAGFESVYSQRLR
jgi:hypothetical protein